MRKDTTKIRPRKLRPMGALEKALYKKFIRVEKLYGEWITTYTVGVQSFQIGPGHDFKYEAQAFARWYAIAMAKMITSEGQW